MDWHCTDALGGAMQHKHDLSANVVNLVEDIEEDDDLDLESDVEDSEVELEDEEIGFHGNTDLLLVCVGASHGPLRSGRWYRLQQPPTEA